MLLLLYENLQTFPYPQAITVPAGSKQQHQAATCLIMTAAGRASTDGQGSWHNRLAGWFGGHAGLPVDGWLTTCCSQVRKNIFNT
jgi:hypothetical protein